jgi:hypothetical protein
MITKMEFLAQKSRRQWVIILNIDVKGTPSAICTNFSTMESAHGQAIVNSYDKINLTPSDEKRAYFVEGHVLTSWTPRTCIHPSNLKVKEGRLHDVTDPTGTIVQWGFAFTAYPILKLGLK